MVEVIRMVPLLNKAYIQYPSKESASKILHFIKGVLRTKHGSFKCDFFSAGGKTHSQSAVSEMPPSDWICEKCDYKNFAKRQKCNKCDKPKTTNCKLIISNEYFFIYIFRFHCKGL